MVHEYAATITHIVDGDTVDLSCDLGFRIYSRDRFRLFGIDTPERGQAGWAEATAALKNMLPIGASVIIRTAKPYRDKYGRWLATIYADGVDINAKMLSDGFAKEYMP